jgi:hypothetical protein
MRDAKSSRGRTAQFLWLKMEGRSDNLLFYCIANIRCGEKRKEDSWEARLLLSERLVVQRTSYRLHCCRSGDGSTHDGNKTFVRQQ